MRHLSIPPADGCTSKICGEEVGSPCKGATRNETKKNGCLDEEARLMHGQELLHRPGGVCLTVLVQKKSSRLDDQAADERDQHGECQRDENRPDDGSRAEGRAGATEVRNNLNHD